MDFPDFPGCVTAGTSLDDAKDMALDALALHIAGLVEDGEAIPDPSSFDAVMADSGNTDAAGFLVSVKPAGKTVRINITMDQADLEAIDAYTKEHSLTRSAFLAKAALDTIKLETP